MRKAHYKYWVKAQKDQSGKIIDGTGTFIFGIGVFHGFGVDCVESESGFGNFSIAIIELPDGKVIKVDVENIEFTSQNQSF